MTGDRKAQEKRMLVECVTSLHAAMQDAGGGIFDVKTMESMSLMEFITTIAAQNNIRFYYKRPPQI